MDREISKEVQRKEQRKQFIRIGTAVGGFIVLIVVVISMLQTSLKRKDLNISTVDKGVIEVSVSASGKVIPALRKLSIHRSTLVLWRCINEAGIGRCRHAYPETGFAERRDGV